MISAKKVLYLAFICMVWMALLMSIAPIDQAQALPTSYYVKGDTGLDTNPGTLLSPFKTIQKCATVMIAGDTCFIRGGVYREPTIIPLNSGTSSTNQIKFAAYNSVTEPVTVSGADLISGWTLESGSIYKATMNWDILNAAGKVENILIVDNQLIGKAKWPNNVTDILTTSSWAEVDSATANPLTEYTITDSALASFSTGYWNGATIVCVAGVSYAAASSTITSFSANTLHFAPWAGGSTSYQPAVGDLYYVTDSLKALDVANEWYKNSATNTLYLWAPGGDSPANHIVEAKKREYGFDLSNKSYIEVNDIRFVASSVKMTSASNIKIISTNMQGATQKVEGSYNEIRNSEISKTIGSGVVLTGQNHSIINNYIHDVNYAAGNYNPGILMDGKNHLISHNTITRGAAALFMGAPSNSIIQYNNIYDAANLTEDVGVIYFSNADLGNTEVHHNWIHDNKSRSTVSARGLFLDNYTSNFIAYENVIWNTAGTGIFTNFDHYFQLYYNNSVYNNSNLKTGTKGYGNQYINNIIYDGLTAPSFEIASNNFTFGNPLYVNPVVSDFHLQSTSPAKDRGRVLTGVTEGYVGSAPDIGAYEYGGSNWTAGHNFTTPPNPVFTLTDLAYKNKITNSSFELGGLGSWTTTGTVQNIRNSSWNYAESSYSHLNYFSAGLDGGGNIQQILTGLTPNTSYVFSSWGKMGGKLIQAENYSTQSGLDHWTITEAVAPLRDGDYLGYANITFNNLYDRLALGLNYTKAGGFIDVRLDSTTGTLLGTVTLPNNFAGWTFQEIPISVAAGTHDLYLVVRGAGLGDLATLDAIKLTSSTMSDSMNIGVKNFNGTSDVNTNITSTLWQNNYLLFTTGANNTTATIYADKPTGNYVGYFDNLGVIQSYLPDGATFYDSFENGFGNWTTVYGTPTISTKQKVSGSVSYILNEDQDSMQHLMPAATNKVAVVKFFDDASDTNLQAQAYVDSTSNTTKVALGVNTNISTTKYSYRIGSNTLATSVKRSTGWHELTFDYRSGTDVKLYIDGLLVGTSTAVTSFNNISLGDTGGDGLTGNVYFDDITVQNALPFEFSDSFENVTPFGNWATEGGTPSTSTTQKYNGSASFVINEDKDYIVHSMAGLTNKVAVVRFYDDAADLSMYAITRVDPGTTLAAIGVLTGTSTTKYAYRVGATWAASTVTRTTGWHEFTFDYRSGTDVKLYIDGVLVTTSTVVTAFNLIYLGDPSMDGLTGTVYYDDVVVQESLPFTLPIFSDSFENGFSPNWVNVNGTPSTSTTQQYSGNVSYVMNQDGDYIYHSMPSTNKVVVVRFYDDAADLSMYAITRVDPGTTLAAVGVLTATSTTKYAYRIGATWAASNVTRTTGWHEFTFDYRSGTDVKLYIDGILVTTSTAVTSFNIIYLGDPSVDGLTGNVYFDDVVVQESLPFLLPTFGDSFETGFGNWATVNGTPTTSTSQKYSGNASYVMDADQDYIVHSMAGLTNKVATVRFYDDAADLSMYTITRVDPGTTLAAIGVLTGTSATKYAYRVGATWAASTVTRTTGWHKFTFDYRSGTDVKLYIDDVLVTTSTAVTAFNVIYLGDPSADGLSGAVYFDEVSVQENLMP